MFCDIDLSSLLLLPELLAPPLPVTEPELRPDLTPPPVEGETPEVAGPPEVP